MSKAHILGYPRIGLRRELKQALETYWRNELDAEDLREAGRKIRRANWRVQREAGLDLVTVGDFSFYDHVLDTSLLLGAVPQRFRPAAGDTDLDIGFRMARGRARAGDSRETYACEMTKWFDTNYHYIVPELDCDQSFGVSAVQLFDEVREAQAAGYAVKPVVLGPLSWLWLGKAQRESFDRLRLLDRLLPVYAEIFSLLKDLGVEWVQVDEPALVLDLPPAWKQAYESAYNRLQAAGPKLLLATYFGPLEDNLYLAVRLPVAGLHIDCVRGPEQLSTVLDQLPPYKILSLGVVDGRNVWRTDLATALRLLQPVQARIGERLWIGSSCSLLHAPLDLAAEKELAPGLGSWLAFARQKLDEVSLLKRALNEGPSAVAAALDQNRLALQSRRESACVHDPELRQRLASVRPEDARRGSPYPRRAPLQRARFRLPLLPTTTIGSFPQTPEIRKARLALKRDEIDAETYRRHMQDEIRHAIREQESIGLDVLVHGEAERNDMVEYFGELLEGMAVTANGWVQSYGSRCVKPPVIYGDVKRQRPMTVEWAAYAQSLTAKPVKGMLTGPVTILQWSFVRDDQPRASTCRQLALALRDEVRDLEAAGVGIIQIDEPALREGLPLRRRDWQAWLDWAVESFRLATSGVRDATQIHTHMCYAEFNDIIAGIAALDADVITIETSRSRMELLQAFEQYRYPNEIGPGVYDIHSPRVPAVSEMVTLLAKASRSIPVERLWINPDCGLKTRAWPEVKGALENMVRAAIDMRKSFASAAATSG
ncbi:MAG TPA: 5-methyltetrahydropteroyltriglutamate--homocysteine S-methyltransferase [Gammaproteobacteria bacterium]|nr:5-methyltetrahydropteroyltriglutamate--homocysteine S-methyltransferase [Gammaproteobacteria bacterium]